MLQFAKRLRLDLANALAGNRKQLANFFKRVIGIHANAETHTQHALFTRSERGQYACSGFAQNCLNRCIDRQQRVLVFDEIA